MIADVIAEGTWSPHSCRTQMKA